MRARVFVCLIASIAGTACAGRQPALITPEPAAPSHVSVPVPPKRSIPWRDRELLQEIRKTGLEAEAVERGLLVQVPTMYLFAFDRAELDADTQRRIRDVAKLLDTPAALGSALIVEGHTDSMGSRAYNQKLSERRAEVVAQELTQAGVARTRITLRAFGQDKPLAPNRHPDGTDNPEGRARNRRVALLIENPPAAR